MRRHTATMSPPNIDDLKPHPYAEVWPELGDDEYEKLKADIQKNGQLVPIVLYQGTILDGRTRYRACMELGLPPVFENAAAADDETALKLAVSYNEYRRHLSDEQRAFAGAKLFNIKNGGDRGNQYTGGRISSEILPSTSASLEEAAAAVKVPVSAVRRARGVLKHGGPELEQAVLAKKVSLTAAYDSVRANKPNSKTETREKVKEAIRANPEYGDTAIADIVPCPKSTVYTIRQGMKRDGEPPYGDGKIAKPAKPKPAAMPPTVLLPETRHTPISPEERARAQGHVQRFVYPKVIDQEILENNQRAVTRFSSLVRTLGDAAQEFIKELNDTTHVAMCERYGQHGKNTPFTVEEYLQVLASMDPKVQGARRKLQTGLEYLRPVMEIIGPFLAAPALAPPPESGT